MNKDFTEQEKVIAAILSEFGIRYHQQYIIEVYTVDFFVPELNNLVIEADGKWGHLRKHDRERDNDLLESGVSQVIHIKEQTKERIKQEFLEKLCPEE